VRVVLVEAPLPRAVSTQPGGEVLPLGLASLAAALSPEHDVFVALPSLCPDPWGAPGGLAPLAERILRDGQPDVVGISATSAGLLGARALARALRAAAPDLLLLAGGVHATVAPQDLLQEPAFDAVFQGEAEETLVAFLRGWRPQSPAPRCPGVWTRAPEGLPQPPAEPAALPDLGRLARPRRSGLLWPARSPATFSGVETARGCRFHCSYCSVPELSLRRVRTVPLPAVLDELAALRRDQGVDSLFFHDSVFTLDPERSLALCAGLREQQPLLPYSCQTRIDCVQPAVLDALAASGCSQILYGVETGSLRSARNIGKRLDRARLDAVIAWTRERGIRCASFFMVGFPWEDEADLDATEDLALGAGFDQVYLFSATPLPGTRLWEESGGWDLDGTFDFRQPERNFSALEEDRFRSRFRALQERFAAYNVDRMLAALR